MKSVSVKKRSIAVGCHKTSISLEDDFWTSLRKIAEERHQALSDLVGQINEHRGFANLSSAIRMFVLRYYADKFCGQEPRGLSPTALVGTVDLLAD
jgi:predicted DNA-binding ribbon-helix-helix protein